MPDDDDEKTKLFLPNDEETFRALQEGDDLIEALKVPEGIDAVIFAGLLRGLYDASRDRYTPRPRRLSRGTPPDSNLIACCVHRRYQRIRSLRVIAPDRSVHESVLLSTL